MSNPTTQLVTDLIRNISEVSKRDGEGFSSTMKSYLESCSTFETYLSGISERQYVHCISQTLQHVADNAEDPEIRRYLWNPIVAPLIKCIATLADKNRKDLLISKPSGNKSSSTKNAEKRTTSNQNNKKDKTNAAAPSKNKTVPTPKNTGKTTTKPVAAVVPPATQQEMEVEKPCTSSAKVDPNIRLRVYSELQTAKKAQPFPFFNQMKGSKMHGPVSCKVPACGTCEERFSQLPLTQCSQIRCHVPNKSCTPSGWYPHVLPHIWAGVRLAHKDKDVRLIFNGLPDEQLPSLKAPTPIATEQLPSKRRWTQADVESSDSDLDSLPSKKSSSPVWNSEPWSSQLNALELESIPSPENNHISE